VGHLSKVEIRRFKRLEHLIIDLDQTNVLIGANNAGKSSVLQAIHFAVSVAQTAKLLGGVSWRRNSYELSFNPSQLLYSPVADVMALASGGTLVEDANRRVEIVFHSADNRTTTVAVRRGRNRNIGVSIEGRSLGEELQNLTRPFSVYAPGLAGIAREEYYMSPGRVRRIVARGDANLVLRNVLLMLQGHEAAWSEFCDDLTDIFPRLSFKVTFEESTEEHIDARYSVDGAVDLPIDSAGTSILQATQLLAYVALFRPTVFILDEPDSHLHPDNQRALCKVVTKIAKKRNVQVILSTHSRHMIDGLRRKAKVVWLSRGSIVEPPEGESADLTALLLDLGALDSVDYFTDGELRFVVATEDENPSYLQELLWASGFVRDEVEVVSYTGCTKVESAIVLGRFLHDKAPNVHMVVHRDRDYLTDANVSDFKGALSKHNIFPFVTAGSDIECYFVNADHLHHCCQSISRQEIDQIVAQALNETRPKSIGAIVNLRTEQAFRHRNKGGDAPNHGRISTEAHAEYDANPPAMMRGKVVLKKVRQLLQQRLGSNPRFLVASEYLCVKELSDILQKQHSDTVADPDQDVLPGSMVFDTQSIDIRGSAEGEAAIHDASPGHVVVQATSPNDGESPSIEDGAPDR